MRLFFTLAAMEGLIIVSADYTNTHAQLLLPTQDTYMAIDEAFAEWWNTFFSYYIFVRGPPLTPNSCRLHKTRTWRLMKLSLNGGIHLAHYSGQHDSRPALLILPSVPN